MKSHSRSFLSLPGLGAALVLFGALAVPRAARAHIKMSTPADWIMTSSLGDPQKITPCGVDPTMPSTFTVTNAVTTLHVGDKVVFNWTETVPHDGHFRISLAINSRDELKDPMVTQMNSDGTAAAVAISTAYPVLADNLFPHTAASVAAGKAYTDTVTIPNTPCAKCTLQLLQFMANHPLDPSYFYHQCADVTILAVGGTGGTSGSTGGSSGSTGGNVGSTGGTGGGHGGTIGSSGGSGGSGGMIGGSGGSGGSGGTTGGTGGATSGNGGSTTGAGGSATGTGGSAASGSGGSAVGSGGSAATGTSGTGAGGTDGGGSSGGCSCELGGGGVKLTGLGLLLVALVQVRRRRGRRVLR